MKESITTKQIKELGIASEALSKAMYLSSIEDLRTCVVITQTVLADLEETDQAAASSTLLETESDRKRRDPQEASQRFDERMRAAEDAVQRLEGAVLALRAVNSKFTEEA